MLVNLKVLSDVITKGTTPSNIGAEFTDSGIMYFRSELVGKSKYIDKSEGLLYISKETHNKLKRSQLEKDDILFSMAGAYLGKISIVGDEDIPSNTNQAVALIRLKDKTLVDYIYYYMKQEWFNDYVHSFNAQAAQPNINLEQIGKLKIFLPREKGKAIKVASILSKYDELIEVNNKRIKILEQTAEELYKEWFVRFRFPGHETTQFENGIPKGWIFGENIYSQKPKNWYYGKLSELGSFVRGKNITSDKMIYGDIPVISAGIEPSGYHNESNVKGASLTISASGANAGYLKYNLSDIWAADCSFYQNDNNIWFVYSSLVFINKVLSNLQVGAAQPHVYPKHINRLSVIIPEERYIKKYNEIAETIFAEIKSIKQQNENLIKQRDLLLPRLMNGKLEV